MDAPRVLATAFLVTMVACGRSSMHNNRDPHPTSGPAAGEPEVTVGNGGRPTSDGGHQGSGGSIATGGSPSTTGSGGDTPGTGTRGLAGGGGRMSTAFTSPTGGTESGGRSSIGGSATGGSAAGGSRGPVGGVGLGGATAAGGRGGRSGTCGDGTVGPGEQCDLGADNTASTALVVTQGALSFAAVPLTRTGSGKDFYSYSSASAHTGFEQPGLSQILLYLDKSTRVLSLLVIHGVDQDTSGLEQPSSTVQFLFSGLPESTAIGISDDSGELIMTSATTATGLWSFTNNSDGGVLDGLPLPGNWSITVEPFFIKGGWTWTWLEADGSVVPLDISQPLTIEAHATHGQCRPDCTIPQCGDGRLDGGEVCDDGQPSSSGCSLNCMSFN